MERLPSLPTVRDVVRMYRLRAQKQLSQNFLMDPRLHHKIVKTAGSLHGCHVLEVGPGPGGLTRAILERGAERLIVLEKDRRFLPSLQLLADASGNRMTIVLGDVMNFPLADVFPRELARDWNDDPPAIHIIGNLPFNVSTPLIIRWLRDVSHRRGAFSYGRVSMTLTFQREVAERMVASVYSDKRCRLTVMCQHLCHVGHKFDIPGGAFVPRPDVDVGVVHFVPRVQPRIQLPFEVVEKFMRNAFHFRQKHCRKGVEVLFPKVLRQKLSDDVFSMSEVDPTTRPFCLKISELGRMANAYYELCQKHPEIIEYDYRAKGADDGQEQLDDDDAPKCCLMIMSALRWNVAYQYIMPVVSETDCEFHFEWTASPLAWVAASTNGKKVYLKLGGGLPIMCIVPRLTIHNEDNDEDGPVIRSSSYPVEVLIAIFLHLSDHDLLSNCRLVCRLWCDVIDSQSLWKRRAERRHACHVPKWKPVFDVDSNSGATVPPPPPHFYRTIAIRNPFGRNLIENSCGESGNLNGWTVVASDGDGWKVENPPKGCDALTTIDQLEGKTSCFATSYVECRKYQLIDLWHEGCTREILKLLKPRIYIREWYAARFDCACRYNLDVKLLDADKSNVLDEFTFEHHEPQWAGTVWNKVEHVFEDYRGARYVRFEHAGIDRQFWAGHFGSKMTGATVRLITGT